MHGNVWEIPPFEPIEGGVGALEIVNWTPELLPTAGVLAGLPTVGAATRKSVFTG